MKFLDLDLIESLSHSSGYIKTTRFEKVNAFHRFLKSINSSIFMGLYANDSKFDEVILVNATAKKHSKFHTEDLYADIDRSDLEALRDWLNLSSNLYLILEGIGAIYKVDKFNVLINTQNVLYISVLGTDSLICMSCI